MSVQANPYPLRIDKSTMEKFKVIAKCNGRSVNKEIEQMILSAIFAFEKEHGSIPVSESKE